MSIRDQLPAIYHHILDKYKSNVLISLAYILDQIELDIFYCAPRDKNRRKYLISLKNTVLKQRKQLESN